MLTIRRSVLATAFVVTLLTTEFFYIDIGGTARIYHFVALAVVLLLTPRVAQLFRSDVFVGLLLFAIINVVAAALSPAPANAFASLASLFANIAVAMAVAMILLSGHISGQKLAPLILSITIISVLWGALQILAWKSGILLALSSQQEPQITLGFGPGFRTEANTFGKYMVLPFLLFLPTYLENPRSARLRMAYLLMTAGILMNFTRTALYGLMAAFLFMTLRYFLTGRLGKVGRRLAGVVLVSALGVLLIAGDLLPISGYAKYKLDNFLNSSEILEGDSSQQRIRSMQVVLNATLDSDKRLLIGNGWGQTRLTLDDDVQAQAGGGDIVNVLGYAGLTGVFAYLLYSALAFRAFLRIARSGAKPQALLAQGFGLALLAMFVTGQMSGYLITPEYWLVLGVAIYLGAERSRFPLTASASA